MLYAALFAAIGSAVDSETDTQQFMMPVTIPLSLGFIMANVAVYNPDGQLAFWFSMVPLTSPIVMMARIPFGVPIEQIWISGALLILGFIFTTWFAARIYRVGILMYGKKVSYRELWKWLTVNLHARLIHFYKFLHLIIDLPRSHELAAHTMY